MESRTLGRTGIVVTRIGLGLAALGRPGYINIGHASDLGHEYDVECMTAQAQEVFDAAWSEGVRYFDAARSYGRGEEFLARWLTDRRIEPRDVTVGSKWGYTYTANWKVEAKAHEIKDHSQATLQRQIAESHGWLGPHLDLYQIHSATLESGVLDDRDVHHELGRLRSISGLTIGLSLSGPRQAETLRRAMEVTVGGERLFDCVQATWNVLEPSAGRALAEAHEAGMGVIVKEALANGRLTPRNNDPAFAAQRQVLDRFADRLGTTLDALALAAVLARPWADVVLSGAATVDQLRSNLAAQQVAWDEQASQDLELLIEPPEVYWATRSGLLWN